LKYNADNKKFWDKVANKYDFVRKSDIKAFDTIISNIKEELDENMTVLELATGTGFISISVAPFCKEIEATDFSEEMIRVAKSKKRPENLSFSIQDATNLPYPDNFYDVVIISNALHIMPNPEKALANIKRVLKNGGVLIAPNFIRRGNFIDRIIETPMNIFGFKTYSKWTYDRYLEFLKENNWKIKGHSKIKAKIPIAYAVLEK